MLLPFFRFGDEQTHSWLTCPILLGFGGLRFIYAKAFDASQPSDLPDLDFATYRAARPATILTFEILMARFA